MQIPHCPCRCHKAFLATFCVGSGDVWPASLSLPSGSLLGLAGGKAQQETGGEVPPVRVLVPCWLHPGWFPVAGHSPARQHLLGSSLTPLGQGSCCPLHYPRTLAVTCSSLTLCVSTQTVYVISPPRNYPNGLCHPISLGTLVSHGDGEPEQRRRLGTCLGGRAKALRQAQWLMAGSEAEEGDPE